MEIRGSSCVRTPFLSFFLHDRIGTPVNWLLSAVGRAYLAYCPENERARILAVLRKSGKPEDWLAGDARRLDQILAETRMKGYGTRDQSFIGGAYGRYSPEWLAGIAVPLLDAKRVHGVINIIWAKAARELDDMVRYDIADLQNAAAEIVGSLRKQTEKEVSEH